MNATLQLIENRRSVRLYDDRPLSREEKDVILQAAMRSPTAGNMMLYTILEVEDQNLKDQLAESCDHQSFIAKAPYVLLFLADYQRWFDFFTCNAIEQRCQELETPYRTPQPGDLLLACCDALIAAQTAVLAAESLGIGSCYIGDILENYETHRRMFDLPPYTLPITLLCFGKPKGEADPTQRTTRFDRKFIVHTNTYRRFDSSELAEMSAPWERLVAGRFIKNAQNIAQHIYFRKFAADFSFEMSRSVREMLKNWE